MKKYLKKKNGWKCKGYILIETMVGIFVSVLLYLILTKGIIELNKITENLYKDNLNKNVIQNTENNLKEYLNRNENLYYEVKDNKLLIYKVSAGIKPLKDEIYRYDDKLYLKYYREKNFNIETYTTLICENVLDFKIVKKKSLVYMIINIGGEIIYVSL